MKRGSTNLKVQFDNELSSAAPYRTVRSRYILSYSTTSRGSWEWKEKERGKTQKNSREEEEESWSKEKKKERAYSGRWASSWSRSRRRWRWPPTLWAAAADWPLSRSIPFRDPEMSASVSSRSSCCSRPLQSFSSNKKRRRRRRRKCAHTQFPSSVFSSSTQKFKIYFREIWITFSFAGCWADLRYQRIVAAGLDPLAVHSIR